MKTEPLQILMCFAHLTVPFGSYCVNTICLGCLWTILSFSISYTGPSSNNSSHNKLFHFQKQSGVEGNYAQIGSFLVNSWWHVPLWQCYAGWQAMTIWWERAAMSQCHSQYGPAAKLAKIYSIHNETRFAYILRKNSKIIFMIKLGCE